MIQNIIDLVKAQTGDNGRNDDDVVDRLNYRYTVFVLIGCALVVTVSHVIGSPITCWAPVHFTGSHTKYATSYCWVRNTYYLPWADEVPRPQEHRQVVTYYQWIPFILIGQAIFFYLPTLVWHMFNSKGGVDSDNILATAHTFKSYQKQENKDKVLKLLVSQMHRFLRTRREDAGCTCDLSHVFAATCCRLCGRRFGNYLAILYAISKLGFLANVLAQFFVLNKVLGYKFNTSGLEIMAGDMLAGDHNWMDQQYVAFPRVTFCDFVVRRLGNAHRYTVQCVLPLNLYNEKIYTFLWFWMGFVFLVTLINFFVWSLRFIFRKDRYNFIKNHLPEKIHSKDEHRLLDRFVDRYLRQDGALILRLMAHNTTRVTTTEVTCALWDNWMEEVIIPEQLGEVKQDTLMDHNEDADGIRKRPTAPEAKPGSTLDRGYYSKTPTLDKKHEKTLDEPDGKVD